VYVVSVAPVTVFSTACIFQVATRSTVTVVTAGNSRDVQTRSFGVVLFVPPLRLKIRGASVLERSRQLF
jgi:hypothetical protein